MVDNAAPVRKSYGLPSNPRSGPALKHSRSQPDVSKSDQQRQPYPMSSSSGYNSSRPSSRARDNARSPEISKSTAGGTSYNAARLPSRPRGTRSRERPSASAGPSRTQGQLPSRPSSSRSQVRPSAPRRTRTRSPARSDSAAMPLAASNNASLRLKTARRKVVGSDAGQDTREDEPRSRDRLNRRAGVAAGNNESQSDYGGSRGEYARDDPLRMRDGNPENTLIEPQLPAGTASSDGDGEDDGGPFWKKMAATLAVNVSKALAATITLNDGDGEVTPLGAESRLTKAMKKYHLERARDLNDLPEWLFDNKERRVNASSRDAGKESSELEPSSDSFKRPGVRGGVANDTSFLASSSSSSRLQHQKSFSEDAAATTPGGAQRQPTRDFRKAGTTADRLQALRERGRQTDKAASSSSTSYRGRGQQPNTSSSVPPPATRRRVALPSGPKG